MRIHFPVKRVASSLNAEYSATFGCTVDALLLRGWLAARAAAVRSLNLRCQNISLLLVSRSALLPQHPVSWTISPRDQGLRCRPTHRLQPPPAQNIKSARCRELTFPVRFSNLRLASCRLSWVPAPVRSLDSPDEATTAALVLEPLLAPGRGLASLRLTLPDRTPLTGGHVELPAHAVSHAVSGASCPHQFSLKSVLLTGAAAAASGQCCPLHCLHGRHSRVEPTHCQRGRPSGPLLSVL